MNLVDLFDQSLLRRADTAALEWQTSQGSMQRRTFGDVEHRSNQVAHALVSRGVSAGDRLCVYLRNSVEFIELFIACSKLGILLVPINILYRERELGHIIEDAQPMALIIDEDGLPFPLEVPAWQLSELFAEATDLPGSRNFESRSANDPAALIYTSGTTGRAKGAVLSHANFVANALALCTAWHITNEDRYLAALPLFHVHGLGNGVVSWLASGCLMRLLERFEAATIVQEFDDFVPTLFFGVPTMYVRLLELDRATTERIGASMRLFVSGSAPLPASTHEAFLAAYGHVVLERYGMSETLMNCSNPYVGERRAGSVGPPLPGVSIRIVNDAGTDVEPGTIGEVVVRGANVFAGYWRQPEATESAFVQGWFRTGDLGELSSDGYVTLRGRRSELIISGGFNIYPREIEELLLELTGVHEAAVVGVADPRRGEVPVAYLVADTSVADSALADHCRQHLASFKLPRAFVRVDALPRTALGKVQKALLPPWSPADVTS